MTARFIHRAGAAGDIDWDEALRAPVVPHIGITPALAGAAALSLEAVKAAADKGMKVSCDLNYRRKLWRWGASERTQASCAHVDVLIANEEDIQMSLGIGRRPQPVEGGALTAPATADGGA